MFTYKRSDRELLVYLIGNASTNGGDASRVGAFFSSLVPRDRERREIRTLLNNSCIFFPARPATPPLETDFGAFAISSRTPLNPELEFLLLQHLLRLVHCVHVGSLLNLLGKFGRNAVRDLPLL